MKKIYNLSFVGGFWEVFNQTDKITVYVSESKEKAVDTMLKLRKGQVTEGELV